MSTILTEIIWPNMTQNNMKRHLKLDLMLYLLVYNFLSHMYL